MTKRDVRWREKERGESRVKEREKEREGGMNLVNYTEDYFRFIIS